MFLPIKKKKNPFEMKKEIDCTYKSNPTQHLHQLFARMTE